MAHQKNIMYEQMLFRKEPTTYRDAYGQQSFGAHHETSYKEVPKRERLPHKDLKYVESLVDYRRRVPFNMYHRPKEILQTNPNVPQTPFIKKHHKNYEEAIRTRPRLVIRPQFPIDDIEDKNKREIIVNDTYTSTLAAMQREAKPYLSVKAPLPEMPAPPNPIFLRKMPPPYVSPEFKIESLHWDRRQFRGDCSVTKENFRIRDAKRVTKEQKIEF